MGHEAMRPRGGRANQEANWVSHQLAKILENRCKGDHRHIELIGGRAKSAEVYPDELCKDILKGLTNQMKVDERIGLGKIGAVVPDEIKEGDWKQYWDDMSVGGTETRFGQTRFFRDFF